MAAPTLETNAAADTLRITGGNSGNPVTWNDVWDWDDGGGSSGGDGDVPKDGGGTAKVNTFMTETVAGAVYLILKSIDFGDSVASTYFQSTEECVIFSSGAYPQIKSNATLKIGEIDSNYGCEGSRWSINPTGTSVDILEVGTSGILLLYGSHFHNTGDCWILFRDGTFTAINSVLSAEYFSTDTSWKRRFTFYSACSWSFNKVLIYNCQNLGVNGTPTLFQDVQSHRNQVGMEVWASVTIPNLVITGATFKDIKVGNGAYSINLVNPEFTVTGANLDIGNVDALIREQYTCNIHIADKAGADLVGATVDCEDQFGTPVFSVNTNAGGDIAEQIITYKQWAGTSETLTTYSPHKFTISKAGYETMVLDAVTVDAPIVWHLELLDELAEGDVRDGVAYGEDSEGNLELPAAGDVESGVGFGSDGVEFTGDFEVPPEADVRDGEGYGAGDSLTKTGSFKKPGEADVRDGEGYGAGDVEFTGTLDLPAEADVEDGVTFDGATKEGNFEAPAEADVEDGVGYGAGGAEFEGDLELPAEEDVEVGVGYGSLGTEFEGTYLGLKGNNLTAVLEKSVALTGHLEKKVSLTGELKS